LIFTNNPGLKSAVFSFLLLHHHQIIDIPELTDTSIFHSGFYPAIRFMQMPAVVIFAFLAGPEYLGEKMK